VNLGSPKLDEMCEASNRELLIKLCFSCKGLDLISGSILAISWRRVIAICVRDVGLTAIYSLSLSVNFMG
jgi:hypothetical protein